MSWKRTTSSCGGVAERPCVRLQITPAVSEFIGVRIPSPPVNRSLNSTCFFNVYIKLTRSITTELLAGTYRALCLDFTLNTPLLLVRRKAVHGKSSTTKSLEQTLQAQTQIYCLV